MMKVKVKPIGPWHVTLPICFYPPHLPVHPSAFCLTAQTFQYEIEFPPSLEGVEQIHYERVSHRLQDLALRSCMGRVFSIAHDLGLQTTEQVWGRTERGHI